MHLENTFKERPRRLVTFETFDQSDEGTWPDPKKYNDKDKYKDKDKDNDNGLVYISGELFPVEAPNLQYCKR